MSWISNRKTEDRSWEACLFLEKEINRAMLINSRRSLVAKKWYLKISHIKRDDILTSRKVLRVWLLQALRTNVSAHSVFDVIHSVSSQSGVTYWTTLILWSVLFYFLVFFELNFFRILLRLPLTNWHMTICRLRITR